MSKSTQPVETHQLSPEECHKLGAVFGELSAQAAQYRNNLITFEAEKKNTERLLNEVMMNFKKLEPQFKAALKLVS